MSEQEEHRTIRKNLLIAYAASVLSTVGGAISGVYTLLGLTGNNIVYGGASLLSVVGLYYIVVYIWISLQDWKSPTGLEESFIDKRKECDECRVCFSWSR